MTSTTNEQDVELYKESPCGWEPHFRVIDTGIGCPACSGIAERIRMEREDIKQNGLSKRLEMRKCLGCQLPVQEPARECPECLTSADRVDWLECGDCDGRGWLVIGMILGPIGSEQRIRYDEVDCAACNNKGFFYV